MKSIIVTGASSGIGACVAQTFLSNGWRVGLIARREQALIDVAEGHENAIVLPCDVTNETKVETAFGQFGHLDVLFNNAGMFGPQTTIDNVSLDAWRDVVDVNLTGMFLCARAAFRTMRHQTPQGGRIINNGSISAHTPREGSICYTTTKHGVTGLTKTLTLDGREFGITCGQIDIGNARTELVEDLQATRRSQGLDEMPTMSVQDVAKAVSYMAELSPEANTQFMMLMASKMPHIGRG